ncbi:MAG: hypothetical protein R3195_04780 [Gemmatimonadota bacterium]|nr:hypothetical protein [Gemmatimonadota bacterium]
MMARAAWPARSPARAPATPTRGALVCAVLVPAALATSACSTVRGSGVGDIPDLNRVEIARCRIENAGSPITTAATRELTGAYRLYMTSASETSLASGRLDLAAAPPATSAAHPVLIGSTDIDAERVGATVPGDTRSTEAGAPGAALYVFADPSGEGALRTVIRLGSESNRLDRQRFDGAHTTLTLTSVTGDGFGGVWSSAASGDETGGEFCAVRL